MLRTSSESPQVPKPKKSRVASSIELPSGQREQVCPATFEEKEANKRRVEMSLEQVEVNAIVVEVTMYSLMEKFQNRSNFDQ